MVPESHPSMYRHTRTARLAFRDNLCPKVPVTPVQFLRIDQCL